MNDIDLMTLWVDNIFFNSIIQLVDISESIEWGTHPFRGEWYHLDT